jgi:hypothetical protein
MVWIRYVKHLKTSEKVSSERPLYSDSPFAHKEQRRNSLLASWKHHKQKDILKTWVSLESLLYVLSYERVRLSLGQLDL